MHVVIRSVSWVLAVATVVVVAVSWSTGAPPLDAGDAEDAALGALAAAGYEGSVAESPTHEVHDPDDGPPVDAWTVLVDVEVDGTEETIELRIQESTGRAVYIDDRIGPDDQDRLLDDREFQQLGRYEDDSNSDRWVLENGLGSVGAVVILGTCLTLARRADTLLGTLFGGAR